MNKLRDIENGDDDNDSEKLRHATHTFTPSSHPSASEARLKLYPKI